MKKSSRFMSLSAVILSLVLTVVNPAVSVFAAALQTETDSRQETQEILFTAAPASDTAVSVAAAESAASDDEEDGQESASEDDDFEEEDASGEDDAKEDESAENEDTNPDEADSGDTDSENTSSGDNDSEDADSEDSDSGDTSSGDADSENAGEESDDISDSDGNPVEDPAESPSGDDAEQEEDQSDISSGDDDLQQDDSAESSEENDSDPDDSNDRDEDSDDGDEDDDDSDTEDEDSADPEETVVAHDAPMPWSNVGLLSIGDPQGGTSTAENDTAINVRNAAYLADAFCFSNPNPGTAFGQFTWDTEKTQRSWLYYNGIMMDAFMMLDKDSYASYVNAFYDANVTADGNVRDNGLTGTNKNEYRSNELESISPARALFDLLRVDNVSVVSWQQKEKYRAIIENIYGIMQNYDTIPEAGNNFYHKTGQSSSSAWNTYQIALDGLYMAQPFFMETAKAIEDGILDADHFPGYESIYYDVCTRMNWIGENLYDPDTHLYNHGWGKNGVGVNGQFWLRAVGWYAAALADVISLLPDDYQNKKADLIAIEKQLFDGMIEYQDPETGMWYNVIDHDGIHKENIEKNYLESSGTALLAYAMMKSYTEGYVDAKYGEAGLRAFNGTAMNYLSSGGLDQTYLSSGVETTARNYVTNDYVLNEAKGAGPFLMASTYANEAASILHGTTPSFKTNSLLLSGQIGVNFFLDLPAIDGVDYNDSYMTFSISGKGPITRRTDYDAQKQNRTNEYYGFTCFVNSIQMADTITATFHYYQDGVEKTRNSTFSIKKYFEAFDRILSENPYAYDEKTTTMVHSLADYGHYVQLFLSNAGNLIPGTDYAELDTCYTDAYAIADIKNSVSENALEAEGTDPDIAGAAFSLTPDSETAVNVFFKPAASYTGSFSATVDGSSAAAEKTADGRYKVTIDRLPAQELNRIHTISVQTDSGSMTIRLSALSYVKAVLDTYTDSAAQNAAASIYAYSKAAEEYIK